MRTVDTNVLARFFVDDPDDPESVRQRPAALAVMSERAFVSVTVLLEFEWVLRGFYEFGRADIATVLRALTGIEHVVIEDRVAVQAALQSFAVGMDFADALHLARSGHASTFATFDRRLARRATARGTPVPVELLR